MRRFFNLKFGDKFEVNGAVYQKENFFCAVRSFGIREFSWPPSAPLYQDFWPWTKVHVLETGAVESLFRKLRILDRTIFSSPPPLGLRVRNMQLVEGRFQPHKDDERTGPSC